METYPVNVRKPEPKLAIFIGVILLIVILAFILIPVFASARAKATSTICIYNLKQQGLAMNLYTQDWDETFPAGTAWMNDITPYMKKAEDQLSFENSRPDRFQCPDAATDYDGPVKVVYGYAYNRGLSRLKLLKLNMPADAVMIYDSSTIFKNAADAFTSIQSPGRHYGGDSIAFTDGHAKWENHDGIEGLRKAMEETEPWFKLASNKVPSSGAH